MNDPVSVTVQTQSVRINEIWYDSPDNGNVFVFHICVRDPVSYVSAWIDDETVFVALRDAQRNVPTDIVFTMPDDFFDCWWDVMAQSVCGGKMVKVVVWKSSNTIRLNWRSV